MISLILGLILTFYLHSMVEFGFAYCIGLIIPQAKVQKLSSNEGRMRGKHLKLVEIQEHGTVCI